MASYSNTSPWKNTKIVNRRYLNHFEIRPVPAESDDVLYVIEAQYTHRPDLLAYDLYGTPKLWWVFAQRNMDSIKEDVVVLNGISLMTNVCLSCCAILARTRILPPRSQSL